jgi:hypothetical protein
MIFKDKKEKKVKVNKLSVNMKLFAGRIDRKLHKGSHSEKQDFFLRFVQNITSLGANAISKGVILTAFTAFSIVFLGYMYTNVDGAWGTSNIKAEQTVTNPTGVRLHKVILNKNGEKKIISTEAITVSNFLKEQGIVIGFNEQVFPDASSKIENGITVSVGVPENVTKEVEQKMAFTTRTVNDINIKKGEKSVDSKGKDGKVLDTLIIQKIGDIEVSTAVFSSKVLVSPVEEVIRVGSMPEVPDPSDITAIQAAAGDLLPSYGWSPDQLGCLINLWTKESHWNTHAENGSSGAYGIPQALPGSKMASVGADWRTNPVTQIRWGLGYIAARYGTPCNAWSNSQLLNWY